jgi:hypothetical protein
MDFAAAGLQTADAWLALNFEEWNAVQVERFALPVFAVERL